MDMKLELVPMPVTDVDRAKAFYTDQKDDEPRSRAGLLRVSARNPRYFMVAMADP